MNTTLQVRTPLNEYDRLLAEKFKTIGKEARNFNDLQRAVFTAVFNDRKLWGFFKPEKEPSPPAEYKKLIEAYRSIPPKSEERRVKAWKIIMTKQGNYIKKLEEVISKNKSDLSFLTEMYDYFKQVGDEEKAEEVKIRMNDYLNVFK